MTDKICRGFYKILLRVLKRYFYAVRTRTSHKLTYKMFVNNLKKWDNSGINQSPLKGEGLKMAHPAGFELTTF